MDPNTAPIQTRVGDIQWSTGPVITANTARDGTGATHVFTADATNGGFVQRVRFQSAGTNIAGVGRLFISDGGTPATISLFAEVSLPATTGSETAALEPVDIVLGFPLPPGYQLLVTRSTDDSDAGYYVTVLGGKY